MIWNQHARARTILAQALLFGALLSRTPNLAAVEAGLPSRPRDAATGSNIVAQISALAPEQREEQILKEVASGNVPEFYRQFCSVTVSNVSPTRTTVGTFWVAPDYLSIGADQDYFLAPLTPMTAQRIADLCGCVLPTRKMVNDIYNAAPVKLTPQPLPPGPKMITVPMFAEHNALVRTQRLAELSRAPWGTLVAGDKKDLVITARLTNSPGKVAIYGWHQAPGRPIQPLYLGHTANWADYSHGVRLVREAMTVNGSASTVSAVLADPELCGLLSDEGVVTMARYATNAVPGPGTSGAGSPALPPSIRLGDFQPTGAFEERTNSFVLEPEVKIHLNAPLANRFAPDRPVLLIFYALPNGNTTEQTIGHKPRPGEDWHFNIQHIGAQTRFLREQLTNRTVVVAYLEAGKESWPAWRKEHGDEKLPVVIATVQKIFADYRVETVLSSHSGGGSFLLGYLGGLREIPDDIVRIAFLDSNYAYKTTNHLARLTNWLRRSEQHRLTVLAYHDDIALLDGKTFVSAEGGTWGRSHAMLRDLQTEFSFTTATQGDLETDTALGGRIEFLLMENPGRKILHTVQVELNGFIHVILGGTPEAGRGYEYFGTRAYSQWIAD